MSPINLSGMGVALITPFKEDDSIDFDALARLLEYQIQNGTDYLVVLGTTGETPSLTEEEKRQIQRFVVERTRGRIPLVLGIGSNNTRNVIEHLYSDDLSGYDAILSVVPYYNKPSQEGIYQHYAAIAQASPLPIILYNVPGRTGVNMTAETTLRLARDFNNIIAIKEASGNISQMDDIIKNKPHDFMVISVTMELHFPSSHWVLWVLSRLLATPSPKSLAGWYGWLSMATTIRRSPSITALPNCSAYSL